MKYIGLHQIIYIQEFCKNLYEPTHDKTNKMACKHCKDSDQPWHPISLNRVFAVRMKIAWVLSYPLCAQRRLWSDWADDILLVLSWGGSYNLWTIWIVLMRCSLLCSGDLSSIIWCMSSLLSTLGLFKGFIDIPHMCTRYRDESLLTGTFIALGMRI